jgi:hypothetical protein
MRRWLLASWLILGLGCGGATQRAQAKTMEHWPSAPAGEVAAVAAGAAAIMTLANPNSARKPEAAKEAPRLEPQPSEQMPPAMLDRLDEAADPSEPTAPCREPRGEDGARPAVPAWLAPDPGEVGKPPDCDR